MKTYIVSDYNTNLLENLYLGQPYNLAGGAYFSNLYYSTDEKQALCIRTPLCSIKAAKDKYIDLIFNNDVDNEFQTFLDSMEEKIKKIIMTKMDEWFESSFDEDTLDYLTQPLVRDFKKTNFLTRVYFENSSSSSDVQIYDSNQNHVDFTSIKQTDKIINLILCKGIKITNQTITIVLLAKQMLIKKEDTLEQFALCEPNNEQSSRPQQVKMPPPTIVTNEETLDDSSGSSSENHSPELVVERNDEKPPTLLHNNENNQNNELISSNTDVQKSTPIIEDNPFGLEEVEVSPTTNTVVKIQEPYEVFDKLYQSALLRARQAKKEAILAYLKLKEIKNTYMIEDVNDELTDDEEDLENLSVMSCEELTNLQ